MSIPPFNTPIQCHMVLFSLRQELFSYNCSDLGHRVASLKSGNPGRLLDALQLSILAARCRSSFAWQGDNSHAGGRQEQTTKALDKYKKKAVKCISVDIYVRPSTIGHKKLIVKISSS